jgi:hypothetical protein
MAPRRSATPSSRTCWPTWPPSATRDRTRDQAHGGVEIRTLKAVSARGFGSRHTKQVIQVTRKVRDLGSRRWRTTTAYAVTSLVHTQASPPRLVDYLRGHWSIAPPQPQALPTPGHPRHQHRMSRTSRGLA